MAAEEQKTRTIYGIYLLPSENKKLAGPQL